VWLREALHLLNVDDIVENMTPKDAPSQLFTCELSFHIPSRGPTGHQQLIRQTAAQRPSILSAQSLAVRQCLDALRRICYHVPDYSYIKFEALRAGDVLVPQVSKWMATHNHADVVNKSHY
jgi:hypothetical protein